MGRRKKMTKTPFDWKKAHVLYELKKSENYSQINSKVDEDKTKSPQRGPKLRIPSLGKSCFNIRQVVSKNCWKKPEEIAKGKKEKEKAKQKKMIEEIVNGIEVKSKKKEKEIIAGIVENIQKMTVQSKDGKGCLHCFGYMPPSYFCPKCNLLGTNKSCL